jgi:alpha-galactosidase
MGWNSYDAFGDTVTEEEVLTNVNYVKADPLAHVWNYVVIDFRWYDPEPPGNVISSTSFAPAPNSVRYC